MALVETLDQRERLEIKYRWHAACERSQLGQWSTTPLGGQGQHAGLPRIRHTSDIELGPPTRIRLAVPPGLTLAAIREAAPALAETLGVHAVRFRPGPRRGDVVAVLLERDPLAQVVPAGLPVPAGHVLVGVDEDGQTVSAPAPDLGHTIVQGMTRSGKSVWTYSLLGQLAGMGPAVRIVGIDPSGITLRPFRDDPLRVLGTADPDRYVEVLGALVEDMDERMAAMPRNRDVLPVSAEHPVTFVVCEELAGMYRVLGKKRAEEVRDRLLGRLLAEGAKVGIRVVLIVQRAEAAVVGAFERAQCSTRLSFRVDNAESVRMLHPAVPAELVAQHATALAGTALLTAPGVALARLRGPYVGGYEEFAAVIEAAGV